MRITTAIALGGALTCLSFGGAGCASTTADAAGGASVAYALGDLEAEVESTPQKIVKAARGALEDLEIHIASVDSTSLDGQVIGHTATDDKVDITVKRLDDTRSRISIRIGIFGDEEGSRRIYDAIRERL